MLSPVHITTVAMEMQQNSFPLIVVIMDIAGNNIKCFRFAMRMHCCQATKYRCGRNTEAF